MSPLRGPLRGEGGAVLELGVQLAVVAEQLLAPLGFERAGVVLARVEAATVEQRHLRQDLRHESAAAAASRRSRCELPTRSYTSDALQGDPVEPIPFRLVARDWCVDSSLLLDRMPALIEFESV